MRAGKLRTRIQIERATRTINAYGEPIDTWAPIATVWADVRAVPGERLAPGLEQPIAYNRWIVRVRAPLDCTPLDRVVLPGHGPAGIEGVSDPDGRGAQLVIAAYEIVPLRETV